MDYNSVMTGSTSITSKDAKQLRSSEGNIAEKFEEMVVQLTAYTSVLGALLGIAHSNDLEHQLVIKKLVVNQALLKQFVKQNLEANWEQLSLSTTSNSATHIGSENSGGLPPRQLSHHQGLLLVLTPSR